MESLKELEAERPRQREDLELVGEGHLHLLPVGARIPASERLMVRLHWIQVLEGGLYRPGTWSSATPQMSRGRAEAFLEAVWAVPESSLPGALGRGRYGAARHRAS